MEGMQRTYEDMTEAQVREDVENELRTYVDNILNYDNCLHDLLVELLEEAIDEIDYDELVEYVMDGIDTDSLKREFIYTFYDSVTDNDIVVEANGFEEASYIMFSDNEYDPKTCEMVKCVENV